MHARRLEVYQHWLIKAIIYSIRSQIMKQKAAMSIREHRGFLLFGGRRDCDGGVAGE